MPWTNRDEPHAQRRLRILQAHPEVNKLVGHDWRAKYTCALIVATQVWLSTITPHLSWTMYLLVAYALGATMTQALFLAIHELSHNLFFKSPSTNKVVSILVNFPMVVPFSIAFRHYHIEHHKFQGTYGIDTDLPSRFETRVFQGPVRKLVWLTFQIVAYALRPILTRSLPLSKLQCLNWFLQCAFNLILYRMYGLGAICYLLLCVLMAGGLHPCAGHFLSEHYTTHATQETFSYYGPLNKLTWNVGYHNEHHDFPYIPGSRLPQLKRLAPEFYDTLDTCPSWIGVMYLYVFSPALGPHSRMRRRQ